MKLGHLVKRFVGSLWPFGPDRAAVTWARGVLQPGEWSLWQQMSKADRRHSVAVARRLGNVPDDVAAAALLHDVGKIEAGLGTFGRVAATVVGAGRARGRMATYLRHDEIGGRLLTDAGARPLLVTWAREHHLPPERWTVAADVGAALKRADDD